MIYSKQASSVSRNQGNGGESQRKRLVLSRARIISLTVVTLAVTMACGAPEAEPNSIQTETATTSRWLLNSQLTSFWKPSLSRLFAQDAAPSAKRLAKRMSLQQRPGEPRSYAVRAFIKPDRYPIGSLQIDSLNYLKDYPCRN